MLYLVTPYVGGHHHLTVLGPLGVCLCMCVCVYTYTMCELHRYNDIFFPEN